MAVLKAEASFAHPRQNPVRIPQNDSLSELDRTGPCPEVPESSTITSALSDAITTSLTSRETSHENAPSDILHSGSLTYEPTLVASNTTQKYAGAQRIRHDDIDTSSRFDSQIRPQHRRDSVYKSSASSDRSGYERWNPDESAALGEEGVTDVDDTALNTHPHRHVWMQYSHWKTGLARDSGPTPSSSVDWTATETNAPEESEDDNVCSIDTSSESGESSRDKTCAEKRPYTSSLGVPTLLHHGPSPDLSIISDAGDQQQLRQKLDHAHHSKAEDVELDIHESLASLPTNESCHELQTRILGALARTRKNQGSNGEFLPRGELYRLVNQESVSQELMKDLSHIQTRQQIQSLADAVCSEEEVEQNGKKKIKSFRKIFALLVFVETTSSIPLFLQEDVSDLDLPLISVNYHGKEVLCRRTALGHHSEPLECFKHAKWSPMKLRNFQEYQWKMVAPFFSQDDDGDVKHYMLQDGHIMPFVASKDTEDEDADRTGGYGRVLMVRIHKEHHNFRDERLCNRGFAIKQQLHDHDRDAFKREIAILKRFSGERSHRHIVSLLATYEQFKKFHLIFYRAEGDLFVYWSDIKSQPVFSHCNVTWVAEQCAGLAEGLLKLHRHLTYTKRKPNVEEDLMSHDIAGTRQTNSVVDRRVKIVEPILGRGHSSESLEQPASPVWSPDQTLSTSGELSKPSQQLHSDEYSQTKRYGRHGDISPGNILWYDDSDAETDTLRGTLKLADFGQAEFNSLLSRTKSRSVANTMTYRPPECDLQPKIIRQSYDIWCLGCVYLEFVTWMLGGSQLLRKFGRTRMTVDVFQNNQLTDTFFQVVRNQETHHVEVMIKKEVTLFIDELHRHPNCTEFFHQFLDMIQNNMLVVESADRKSCEDVWRFLNDMHTKCNQDKEYATITNPWCIRREPMPRSVGIGMTKHAERVCEKNLPTRLAQPTQAGKRQRGRVERGNMR